MKIRLNENKLKKIIAESVKKEVNKYRDLSPEEKWEITDNLTSQDIMNGVVDHYLNDNAFWRDIEYEHPDLISFLDNRLAIIDKKYGLEKLHQLSKKHPNKKLQQAIMWHNYENTNENKNMAKNKIKITENELKQIVAESVKNILSEARKPKDAYFGGYFFEGIGFDRNGNPIYSSKHLPIEVMDVLGWRKSSKWGRCGYAADWDIRHALKELDLPFGNDEEEYYNSLNEAISPDYRSALKQLFAKSFGNLDDNEKQFLYDLLNNEPWETIYIALGVLESNRINESRKKREPRRGTIELNGKHIDAVEDGLDKNGNPMYKVNDPSIKGRRCKDGSIRVQHYNFKPNRINEGVYTFKPNAASKEKGMIDNLNKKVDEIIKKQYPNVNFYYEDDEAYDAYAEALLNLGFKKDGRDRHDCEVFSNGTLRVVIGLDSINNSLIIHKANGYASTLGL